MTDIRPRQDSSRDLLEELEDGWATPTAPGVRRSDPKVSAAPSHGDEATSEVAGDASEETEAEAAPTSSPNLDRLDEGWLDELFDEDDEDEDEDDDDEEPEPELPDERLDPIAFAEAKKAREEHAKRKKEKRRAKLSAKRTRQKAKQAANRQKQKSKKAKAAPPPTQSSKRKLPKPSAATPAQTEDVAEELVAAGAAAPRPALTKKKKPRASTLASIRLLAIVLGVLLALAALAAAIIK